MSLTIVDKTNVFQKDVIGNVRTAQEDSHDVALQTPNGQLFVVCDGMGGHVGGKQASSIAVRSIIEYFNKEKYSNPKLALAEALQFANMQILGYANEHPELRGMGTTACIVLLRDYEAYIAHVGDSRIYLYLGKEKQLHRITKDHSYVQTLVDAGLITDEEAEHHPNKNRILKALGIKQDLSPTIDVVCPKKGDVFMICSDGLCGMVPDYTMRNVLMQKISLESKGETLIRLALEAGGLDNITLELVRITNSSSSKSVFRSYNPADKMNRSEKKPRVVKSLKIAFLSVAACVVIGVGIYVMVRNRSINQLKKEIAELQKDSAKIESDLNKETYNYKEYVENIKKRKEDGHETGSKERERDSCKLKIDKYKKELAAIKEKLIQRHKSLEKTQKSQR